MRAGNGYTTTKISQSKPQHSLCNHPIALDQYAAARAVRAAYKASKTIKSTSTVFDPRRHANMPRFSREEIELGVALGRGGFNDVYEIQRININSKCNPQITSDLSSGMGNGVRLSNGNNKKDPLVEKARDEALQTAARCFTSEHCVREKTGQTRYAIKFLSCSTMRDASSFRIGAADLITETMFLSSLEHPNIIKIRGVCDQGVYGFASGLEGGFFILLDRLEETLESRLETWAAKERKMISREKKKLHFLRKKFHQDSTSKRRDCFAERLSYALDICAALAYLHSHHIVYRDLKPENIGFDCRGDVKIFDFGLATELHPKKHFCDDLYRLTGQTGSLRYMAPEVARDQPYNLSADVYSFAILLWELCSLKLPYDGMDRQTHSDQVIYGSHRPSIDDSWCFPLRSVMARGWSSDIQFRPKMDSCYKIIRKEVVSLRDGDDAGLEHSKRRSTYVFKAPSKKFSFRSMRKILSKESIDNSIPTEKSRRGIATAKAA